MDKGAAQQIRASPITTYTAPRVKFMLPLLSRPLPIISPIASNSKRDLFEVQEFKTAHYPEGASS
jgi:hypothetical protein